MDRDVIEALRAAGIDPTLEEAVPILGICLDEHGQVVPVADDVTVVSGDAVAAVRLRNASELFTGDARPPSFERGPTP